MAQHATTFHVRCATPHGVLFDAPADLVVLPAQGGEMGVLAYHMPMVVALTAGTVRVGTSAIEIAGGFAHINTHAQECRVEMMVLEPPATA